MLINEETEYRSGPQLINFFSQFGFSDSYGNGFPSRWVYTEDRLKEINGTPNIDKCIKQLFAPVNFIGRFDQLDELINEFNQYLAFDNWKVVRKETEITFQRADKIDFSSSSKAEQSEEEAFLTREFDEIDINSIGLDSVVTNVLESRFQEIKECLRVNAPLSAIFLCGSTLEGLLLGIANKEPRLYNQSNASPKKPDGCVKQFHEWTLNDLINVSHNVGYISLDVKKFSHSLRDFRNYIHPFEQVASGFNPTKQTALISWQVLKAALDQVNRKINENN